VATYEYRCDADGGFEVRRPVGSAPPSIACPACGDDARRVFSAPIVLRGPREIVAAIDHAEKSRDEPPVVTSLPPRDPRKRTPVLPMTPTLRRLPRP
jgi:putative FmdB family regulatory protein